MITEYQFPFFVSQQDQELHSDVGCGVASLMMLLKAGDFEPLPSWGLLCHELALMKPPLEKGYSEQDPEIGLYPEDLMRYVVRHKLKFRIHFYEDEWQFALKKAPIMVLMDGILEEYPEDSHWVVLVDMDETGFIYLDPWQRHDESYVLHMSNSDFKVAYTGIALQILDVKSINRYELPL